MARNMGPNDDRELTRALKALKEEQRTRQQAEEREEQGMVVDHKTRGCLAEEVPPQRALAPVVGGSIGKKGQMYATRGSGRTSGQG